MLKAGLVSSDLYMQQNLKVENWNQTWPYNKQTEPEINIFNLASFRAQCQLFVLKKKKKAKPPIAKL